MQRIDIQKLLSVDGYWTVNKHLARKLGFTATILLQQLIELQCEYFPNGDFYQQQDELANKLGISEKVLASARKTLVDENLLIARRGYLAKYYYTVLLDNITRMFEGDKTASSESTNGNLRKVKKVTANRKKQGQKEIKQKEIKNTNKKALNPLTLGQEAILDDSFAKQEPYSNDELMVLSIDI